MKIDENSIDRHQLTSIVNYFNAPRVSSFLDEYSFILLPISVLIFCFNVVHSFLILFGVEPAPDTSPLITGHWQIMVIHLFADITLGATIFACFKYKTDFTHFESKCSQLGLCEHGSGFSRSKFNKMSHEINFVVSVVIITWTMDSAIFIYQIGTNKLEDQSLISSVVQMVHIFNYLLIPILGYSKIYSLCSSSMVIRSLFKLIGYKIKSHSRSTWTNKHLTKYRLKYSDTIDLTNISNKIWCRFLTFFYPIINIFGIFVFYYIISGPVDIYRYSVLGTLDLSVALIIVYTNRYIIGINVEAASIYDIVYCKSLYQKDAEYLSEVKLKVRKVILYIVSLKLSIKISNFSFKDWPFFGQNRSRGCWLFI